MSEVRKFWSEAQTRLLTGDPNCRLPKWQKVLNLINIQELKDTINWPYQVSTHSFQDHSQNSFFSRYLLYTFCSHEKLISNTTILCQTCCHMSRKWGIFQVSLFVLSLCQIWWLASMPEWRLYFNKAGKVDADLFLSRGGKCITDLVQFNLRHRSLMDECEW